MGKHYALFWKQADYQAIPGMLIQWRNMTCLSQSNRNGRMCTREPSTSSGWGSLHCSSRFQHRREGQDSVGSGLRRCFISIMNRSPRNTLHWLTHFQCLQVSSPNNAMSPQRQSMVLPLYSFWHLPHRGSIDLWALSDLKRTKQLKARLWPQLRVLQQAEF